MRYRKKPVVIDANPWFKMGDHPKVGARSSLAREFECGHCGNELQFHGWVDCFEGGHKVCPGDWVITGVKGEISTLAGPTFLQMTCCSHLHGEHGQSVFPSLEGVGNLRGESEWTYSRCKP